MAPHRRWRFISPLRRGKLPHVFTPVIVIVDASYVGHEGIADELGHGYAVTSVSSFAEAQAAIVAASMPIVIAPETLTPEPGRRVLANLAAAGHAFVGLLMVDDAQGLPRPAPGEGVTHLAFRPLRPGEFRRHIDAAAACREARLHAGAREAALAEGLLALAADLQAVAGQEPSARPRLLGRLSLLASALARPLETAPVDPVALARDAFSSALQVVDPDVAPAALPIAVEPGRHPRLFGDARLLGLALDELIVNALTHGVASSPSAGEAAVQLSPSRDGDRDGWLFQVESPAPFPRETPGPTAIGLRLARIAALRHHGHLAVEPSEAGPGRVSLWLPEGAS